MKSFKNSTASITEFTGSIFQEKMKHLKDITVYKEVIIYKYEGRLDLLSKLYYGSAEYSQILQFFNGLTADEFKIGTKIKVPDINQILNYLVKHD